MTDNVFIYSVSVWFFFWLFNYSDICAKFKKKTLLFLNIYEKLSYLLQCPFCITFWVSVYLFIIGSIDSYFIFVAPVINLFVDLFYKNLNNGTE